MIIWLASYPKSGNTWVRAMLSSLLYTDDGYFNVKNLYKIDSYPNRQYFKNFINDFRNIHEIKKYWIASQDKLNLDKNIKFFKTHNALCKIDNYFFSNSENTLATIYIVRDPRNVITSLKNHYNFSSIEEAKSFVLNDKQILTLSEQERRKFTEKDTKYPLPQMIGSWGTHYKSWKKMKFNYLLIKYEDLIEISRLRERMEQELARENIKGKNVKLGFGGLADIEFLVQVLQLMHGKKFSRIRETNTFSTIKNLVALSYVSFLGLALLFEKTNNFSIKQTLMNI